MRKSIFMIVTMAALAVLLPLCSGRRARDAAQRFRPAVRPSRPGRWHACVFTSSPGEDNYIEFAPDRNRHCRNVPDPPAALLRLLLLQTAPNINKADRADLREMLARAGNEHNLDVDLLASVVKAESDGNAHAVSHAGAQGLMQLMPGTAAGLGVQDSFQPEQNVRGGSAYLDALLTRYHDNLALALAAYNAGPDAVDKYHGIPPYRETRVYVARVIHEFNRRVLAREAQSRHAAAATAQPPASH